MRPTDPSHYPPRDRATNVEAISTLAASADQETYERSMQALLDDYHPGLLHELDVAVASAPPDSTEGYEHLGSEVFLSALPRLLQQRRSALGLDGERSETVEATVDQHRTFFAFFVEHHPDPGSVLGADTIERVERRLAQPAPSDEELSAVWYDDERARIQAVLGDLDDIEWVIAKLNAELCTAMLVATDNPLARLDARRFVQQRGAYLPTVEGIDGDRFSLELAAEGLETLGRDAAGADLHHYSAFCRAAADVVRGLDQDRLDQFRGRIGLGSGHCGNCSMNYAATGLASFDPTCPGLFDGDDGEGRRITLTLEHTTSTCPFCQTRQRIHAPALFYAPERNQVVYHLPMVGVTTEDEAIEAARPIIEELRQSYLERVDEATAAAFERAPEEICFDMLEFLSAIQLGTTARENHAFNLVGYDGGGGAIIDATKEVIIELTAGEFEAMSNQ